MTERLPAAQERRLLRKHLTGDFGPGTWPTIAALIKGGYVSETQGKLIVTEKGRKYCDEHHQDIK
jgi:hypothetical protein